MNIENHSAVIVCKVLQGLLQNPDISSEAVANCNLFVRLTLDPENSSETMKLWSCFSLPQQSAAARLL